MSDMKNFIQTVAQLNESVTDYDPPSQGGTRKELLAKYAKSKSPADAEAARKAGATQRELQGAKNGVDEGRHDEFDWVQNLVKDKEAAAAVSAAPVKRFKLRRNGKIIASYDDKDEAFSAYMKMPDEEQRGVKITENVNGVEVDVIMEDAGGMGAASIATGPAQNLLAKPVKRVQEDDDEFVGEPYKRDEEDDELTEEIKTAFEDYVKSGESEDKCKVKITYKDGHSQTKMVTDKEKQRYETSANVDKVEVVKDGAARLDDNIAESNDYFRRRQREEDIISGKKPARKKSPAQTSDYANRREKEKKSELGESYNNNVTFIGKFSKDGKNYSLWQKGDYWYELTRSSQDAGGAYKSIKEWQAASVEEVKDQLEGNGFAAISNESADANPYHRVLVTLSDPYATMASKRGEKIQKHIRVTGDLADAVNKAKAHYKKKGYRVHDAEVVDSYAIAESKITEIDNGPRGRVQTDKINYGAARGGSITPSKAHIAANKELDRKWRDEEKAAKLAKKTPRTSAPKFNLDAIWRKVEDVVGRIAPDGDPVDWLGPWCEEKGIPYEMIDKAARKNGYKDVYDYYSDIANQYNDDNGEF